MKLQRWRIVASIVLGLVGFVGLLFYIKDHIRRLGPSLYGVEADWAEGIAFGLIPILVGIVILNCVFEVAAWIWMRSRSPRG